MLEKAGCFAIVIQKVPAALAKEVAESLSIPIIGIGAGNGVDGQVLVTHDMLGMTYELTPISKKLPGSICRNDQCI